MKRQLYRVLYIGAVAGSMACLSNAHAYGDAAKAGGGERILSCTSMAADTVSRMQADTTERKAGFFGQDGTPVPKDSYGWNGTLEEQRLLMKLAMAEAEGESVQCKEMVIRTVLNRVESPNFPDTVKEVIYQCDAGSGVYQFSCIGDGRFEQSEPDGSCRQALHMAVTDRKTNDGGVLYFETCGAEDNWHSRNLAFLFQCGPMRFYTE